MPQPISLDQLQIREPCHESWDRMHDAGGGRRHCDSCVKSVHDFSAMSRDDVERLLSQPGESPCVRFARGADGRVLTREDFAAVAPAPPSRRLWLRHAAAIAATLGLGSLFNLGCDRQARGDAEIGAVPPATMPAQLPGRVMMGDIDVRVGKPAPTTAPSDIQVVKGEATMPAQQPKTPRATQPAPDPEIAHTMGMIAPRPPVKSPPAASPS